MQFLSKIVGVRCAVVILALLGVLMIAGCGGSSSSSNNVTAAPAFSPGGGTYNATQTVTISDATPGAALYCTTDGSTPTASSTPCPQPVTIFKTESLQAIAVAPGKSASSVGVANYIIDLKAAATPTFSPAGATYASAQTVTIASATAGANIFYTTDGSIPTTTSTLYTGPVKVSTSQTLTAIAMAAGYDNSGVASAAYTIGLTPAAPPTFLPGTGAYTSSQQVTINDTTPGATIYFTTDGVTVPTTSSTKYTGPITVSAPEVIQAIAVASGYGNSSVASAAYAVNLTPTGTPSFAAANPPSTYTTVQQVTLSDATPGAKIYYTTDGITQPTPIASELYSGSFTVSSTETIMAIAVAPGYANSGLLMGTYTINLPTAETPTFPTANPPGPYLTAQTVTLGETTQGATIYYTTDGITVPTISSTTYNGPITVSQTETIWAMAAAPGYSNSGVLKGTYTIGNSGSTISGKVMSGSSPVSLATVQLYVAGTGLNVPAGTSPYGSGSRALGTVPETVTTDNKGQFALGYTCPSDGAPDDQLYLVASTTGGGGFNGGTNPNIVLMTALGTCGSLAGSTTVTINEVTTVASAYALSAFAEVNTAGFGIDIGAPATYDATKAPKCDLNGGWQSTGKETCNYTGLVNAFKTVNNLVDIASGTARSHTPDYPQTLSIDTAIVNNSTVPTARINALADMLAACVETSGSACGGSLFPAAKPADGTAPVDTLQAALDIAQNPGNNVSALLGLVASLANPPYPTTLNLSGGSAPTDLTLVLTFTGAGLGIAPGTTSPTPVVNNAMAIDAAGDLWVIGSIGPNSPSFLANHPFIAEFSNAGKPLTMPTTLSAYGGYQPGSNWNLQSASSIAIDPLGSLWIGGFGGVLNVGTVGLAEVFPDLSGSSSPVLQPGLPTVNGVMSVAIDGRGNVWTGETNSNKDEYDNGGTILSPHDANGIPTGGFGAATLGTFGNPSMLFDSNGYLWAENNDGTGDLDLFNTTANTLNVVPPPYINGSDNPAVPAPTGSIVYDPYGSAVTYNTNNFTYFDGEHSPVAVDGSGNIYGCGSGGGNAAIAVAWVIKNYTPPDNNGNGGYIPYNGPIGWGSGTGYLDVSNAASLFNASSPFSNPFAVPVQYAFPAAYVATGRGCGGGQTGGGKMVIDGLGHIFALSGGTGPSDPAGTTTPGLPGIIDEFTTVGVAPGDPTNPNSVTMISPAATGYTGTSSGEPPAINPDTAATPMIVDQLTGQPTDPASGIADAAMDGSGNLWVLNADTGPSGTYKGNALVEYVGIGAPVVTPPSLGLANKSFGVRP